jgi:hypothetical protein
VSSLQRSGGSARCAGGKNIYGVPVGILLLESQFPRIPGDVGNADTWPFPVQFRVIPDATPMKVVRHLTRENMLDPIMAVVKDLERSGVGLITTGCGFLVLLQEELQASVSIPVLTSSLLQVPWVAQTLPAAQVVCVLTIDAPSLTADHLAAAGVTPDAQVLIAGLDAAGGYFTGQILGDRAELDPGRALAEHLLVAQNMVKQHSEIGAFVLECTNMPPYAADIADATGRPVYDLTTLVGWAVAGVRRRPFKGYL